MNQFDRITVDTQKMGSVPCIRGLRIPVATVLGLLADGMTPQSILDEYPDLEEEDIHQALGYAAYLARECDIPITAASWNWSSTIRTIQQDIEKMRDWRAPNQTGPPRGIRFLGVPTAP